MFFCGSIVYVLFKGIPLYSPGLGSVSYAVLHILAKLIKLSKDLSKTLLFNDKLNDIFLVIVNKVS